MKSKLRVGVARAVITPKVGCNLYGYRDNIISTAVLDDLNASTFYFEQSDTKALMISCDVASINTQLHKRIAKEIEKQFDIPKDNCIISATHTHSGPNTTASNVNNGWGVINEKYIDNIFIPGILGATEEAINSAIPATVGYAYGDSKVGINRREMKISSKEYTSLGQNEWGCYNPKMTVISFRDENGDNIGTMIHYGCHATSAGGNTEISRDWPGVMVDQLEKVSGGIVAFFNGPEGDVGPRLSNGGTTGRGDISYIYEIGLRIDKESSIPHILSLAVTNGCECYFPTYDQLLRKGYETEMYEFYHIQPFGDQLKDNQTEPFCGHEFRSNDISSAILRVQLTRMDGIIEKLRANKRYVMDALAPYCTFAPSNDIEGDCGVVIALQFKDEESARKFATSEGMKLGIPIDTGKHVYKNWTHIMNKKGAFNPLMDPFKMEANKDIVPDYKEDMCPKSLDILSRTVYIGNPPQ